MKPVVLISLFILACLAWVICHSLMDLAKFILIIVLLTLSIVCIAMVIKNQAILDQLTLIEDRACLTNEIIKEDLQYLNYKITNLNGKIDETVKKDVMHNLGDIVSNAFDVMSPALEIMLKMQGNPIVNFGFNLVRQFIRFKK